MSASTETAAGAAVTNDKSSQEIRIPITLGVSGDSCRGGSQSPGSKPVDFRSPETERSAYLIKWSRFEEQLSNAFAELFCSEDFSDVTLACDGGGVLKAHKIILAMSSPFFRRIFIDTPCKHPIIVLKEFSATVMRNILQYLYMGKVVLNQNEISSFMDAADFFGICGVIPDHYSCDIFATTISEPDHRRFSEKEAQSESDSKLSEGSHASDNEESNEISDSKLVSQDAGNAVTTQSSTVKYHGIKARWTRRYSNTSFHSVQNVSSSNVKEHKRSSSAGEVESAPRSLEVAQAAESPYKIPRFAEDLRQQPLSCIERTSAGDAERIVQRPFREGEVEENQRRIIQRVHAKDYSAAFSNPEDSSDISVNEWKNQAQMQTTYFPSSISPTQPPSAPRTIRPAPYILGAKDFSHPLQISVDTPKQIPPMYTVSSTSSGVLDPGKSKSHSGFTLYTSPSPHPSHSPMRSMLRQEPDMEFSQSTPTMPHFSHGSVERSPMRYRQLSSPGSSTTASPTSYRQPEYVPRTHFSLLSTHGWPFQDNHYRQRQHLEDTRGSDNIESRFRSDSLDRGLGHFTSSMTRGTVAKSHAYPPATDLTVPVSQQHSLGFMSQLRSPSTISTATSATRPKTKAIRSSQVPQSSRYTAAEVDQMVDAVANYPGNIVPCTLCQKFVKRERLRAHIHECHLLTGEKIICPHCGIALKSKGSFRVHIWRHKRGALPTRSTMSDFEGGRPPSPSRASGPASH